MPSPSEEWSEAGCLVEAEKQARARWSPPPSPTVEGSFGLLLKRLKTRLGALEPGLLQGFRPGATPEAIAAVESRLNVSFSDDLHALYLAHDGTSTDIIYGKKLNSLEEVMSEWGILEDLQKQGEFDDELAKGIKIMRLSTPTAPGEVLPRAPVG